MTESAAKQSPPVEMPALVAALARSFRSRRSSLSTEERIQSLIAEVLGTMSVPFAREHNFSPQDRVDFFLPDSGLGIEVKKGTANLGDMRQIGRYLEHPECRGCIVVALRVDGIPATFQGKPVHAIEIWKLLL